MNPAKQARAGAGYSGTPLAKKLGIKPGVKVVALRAPEGYRQLLEPLPEGVRIVSRLPPQPAMFIHFFASCRRDLEGALERLERRLDKAGMLWISWAKKSSTLASDLDGGGVRSLGLAAGLVDVKVCAIDSDWSGHKFVYRLKDR